MVQQDGWVTKGVTGWVDLAYLVELTAVCHYNVVGQVRSSDGGHLT